MTKTPPHRRGITFEVGAALEARDSLKNWYAASIEKIDYEDEKVLIHYRQWSHRYDEWFDWSSPYLRPVERIQLRRQGLQEHNMAPVTAQSRKGFQINQKVLASWSDCRYYPAKILSCDKDDFYTVKFFDGVVKTVKGMKIKPFRKENTSNKPGQPSRKRTAGKNCKTKENGRNRQDGETESEEEDSKGTEKCGKLQDTLLAKTELPEMANGHQAAEEKPSNEELKTETQENGGGEVMEMDKGGDEEKVSGTLHNGAHESCGEEQEKEEQEKEATLGQNRKRGKVMEGKDTDQASVPELRKRRASTGQTPPSKRSRANTTDRNNRSQVRQARSDSVPESFSDKDGLCKTGLLENPKPIAQTASSPDLATLLQRQVHLPTTNKYSREPLYRVIKNQPPPILSIELDHNPFKCQVPGCSKSFRKASLLHYHMKYYHSESELCSSHSTHTHTAEPQAQDSHTHPSETPRRRRTVSASQDTPSPLSDSKSSHTPSPHTANGVHRQRSSSHCERSKENQHTNRTLHDDRDWVTMETEREKRRDKKQRDFCIKPKKKKKKKKRSKSGEDSGSDWSTDSPLWSEEESETGLDLNTPFSEQGVETVGHDSEIVRCVCEVQEENDFMIQCDECLCWQHGTCMGLYEDSVPDTYSCYICRDPPAQRQSQRYWYDKDWLSSGHMYGLPFLEENYSHQNGKKMAATHQLLGDVHRVFEVLNGLQLKMSILQAQAHPDLKLWRQPWKPSDGSLRKGAVHSGMTTPSPPSPRAADYIDAEQVNSKQPVPPACSFQTSYISSEHCYQKPHTYYPALEQRLVVETRSTEELLELETRKLQLTNAKELECRMKLLAAERENSCVAQIKEEEPDPVTCDSKPDPDLLLHQQWQLNLLEHIEAVQDEVSHRMDLIERELDVLESWLDYTGELEPPEPLARLPQLKHRIRQLLTDLGTVQKIALCSSST
ncbi:PHD finger protein 20b isoform X4 [Tachysurus fulvidraco]|uniref:PHD finger protein 20b isoform X4 n=1 Tax=Tachysurus fulvidraco TaxID=1234273 RepID=UPI000F50E08A|nr:PHD finger protein 20b isoform X4 [Tachysurus fulvidraco]